MVLTQNGKLMKTSRKRGLRIASFDLPPGITCPNALQCKAGCYGKQGWYVRPCVQKRLRENHELSLSGEFCLVVGKAITTGKYDVVRIHSTGDFYSEQYLSKWLRLWLALPDVQFYAYTKMVSMFKLRFTPSNFTVVYSYGGTEDHLINPSADKHSVVFRDMASLKSAGYVYTNEDDLLCWSDRKIGLVYHGQRHFNKTGWI